MTRQRTALLLYCKAGGGHLSVTRAIAGAASRRFGNDLRLHLVDGYAGALPPARYTPDLYAKLTVHAPRLWGFGYHVSNGPAAKIVDVLNLVQTWRTLHREVDAAKPDVVVVLAPCFGLVAHWLTARRVPIVTVATDLAELHRNWFGCPRGPYLVATDWSARSCEQNGIAPERIKVTGLPLRPEFERPAPDREATRTKLGLDPKRPTCLIVGGAMGAGGVAASARRIAQLAPEVQLICVAGNNERLRRRLVSLRLPGLVRGFAHDVPELVAAADVVISKAGPTTIAEALTFGRPLVVSGALPGQEESNTRLVAEREAALVGFGPERTATAVRQILDDRSLAARLAAAGRFLDCVGAADRVSAEIGRLAGLEL
ncbi:MAG: glycosyltransferase [Chloroflexi bacterium]|nr:glycosyltransferase [Chloroflexota bacterium]